MFSGFNNARLKTGKTGGGSGDGGETRLLLSLKKKRPGYFFFFFLVFSCTINFFNIRKHEQMISIKYTVGLSEFHNPMIVTFSSNQLQETASSI